MPVFVSKVDVSGEEFAKNRADMMEMVSQLSVLKNRAKTLSEKRRSRFEERGQLTPRERVAQLLDSGMPFVELYGLANFLVDTNNWEKSIPGGSSIAGIGFVSGVRVMVFASDSGINAGAMTQKTGDKMHGCIDMALRFKLPFLHLVESAGANLMEYQVEAWAWGGRIFSGLAKLSAAGIPTFAVLHGPSTAGGAYFPGLSDYVIGVRGRGQASLGGAALVKAATGEVSNDEDLAGAEMHATTTGSVDYLAENDAEGLQMLRDIVARLDWNSCNLPRAGTFTEPVYDPDELAGVVPVDYRQPYDVREVAARLVDGSDFEDFKPLFGSNIVCLQASIHGHAVGLVGNNGPIDPDAANKATHFFQLCEQAEMPLILLNNITGYMVGKSFEQGGMIKHGSKMIQAITNLNVPKLTFYIGASFGAGNYGMAGLAYDPSFLFTWPNATTGVMGGDQAAATMDVVARAGAQRKGVKPDEGKLAAQKERLKEHFDSQSSAFYTSGRLLDQGMIDPRDTRKVIGFALDTCAEAAKRKLRPLTFGAARM